MDQYPQHIYPAVIAKQNFCPMEFTEHWRQRLTELIASYGLSQAAFAERVGITPDYISRLLYEPGKKGRKNLGPTTINKISQAFSLPPGWFDMPAGDLIPNTERREQVTQHQDIQMVRENDARGERGNPGNPYQLKAATESTAITWPFSIVTYARIQHLKAHFKGKKQADVLSDIDKHLDVLVTRWENEIQKQKSSAA